MDVAMTSTTETVCPSCGRAGVRDGSLLRGLRHRAQPWQRHQPDHSGAGHRHRADRRDQRGRRGSGRSVPVLRRHHRRRKGTARPAVRRRPSCGTISRSSLLPGSPGCATAASGTAGTRTRWPSARTAEPGSRCAAGGLRRRQLVTRLGRRRRWPRPGQPARCCRPDHAQGLGTESSRGSAIAALSRRRADAASDAVLDNTSPDSPNPASCTFVAAVLEDGLLVAGNVGDSSRVLVPGRGRAGRADRRRLLGGRADRPQVISGRGRVRPARARDHTLSRQGRAGHTPRTTTIQVPGRLAGRLLDGL